MMHEELVQGTVLHGTKFNANNGKLYDFLQLLTLNGPAWPWMNSFQGMHNGIGGWKALIAYDFSIYVAVHHQTHQDLLRLNEPILKKKKVKDFLAGITDWQCAPIKLNV